MHFWIVLTHADMLLLWLRQHIYATEMRNQPIHWYKWMKKSCAAAVCSEIDVPWFEENIRKLEIDPTNSKGKHIWIYNQFICLRGFWWMYADHDGVGLWYITLGLKRYDFMGLSNVFGVVGPSSKKVRGEDLWHPLSTLMDLDGQIGKIPAS